MVFTTVRSMKLIVFLTKLHRAEFQSLLFLSFIVKILIRSTWAGLAVLWRPLDYDIVVWDMQFTVFFETVIVQRPSFITRLLSTVFDCNHLLIKLIPFFGKLIFENKNINKFENQLPKK